MLHYEDIKFDPERINLLQHYQDQCNWNGLKLSLESRSKVGLKGTTLALQEKSCLTRRKLYKQPIDQSLMKSLASKSTY